MISIWASVHERIQELNYLAIISSECLLRMVLGVSQQNKDLNSQKPSKDMDLIWIVSFPQFSLSFVRFCSILWVPWSTADFMLIWRLSRESLLHHKQPQGSGEHFFGFWVRHKCRIWNLSLARLWRSVPIQASAGLRIVWLQPRRCALDGSYQGKSKILGRWRRFE